MLNAFTVISFFVCSLNDNYLSVGQFFGKNAKIENVVFLITLKV